MSIHEREQTKRCLLDFLAGLVFLSLRSSHPVMAALITPAIILLPLNPHHWDNRDENGEFDAHYIAIRIIWFGASFFVYLFITGLLFTGGPPNK